MNTVREYLTDHYQNFPFDMDSQQPENGIQEILKSIGTYSQTAQHFDESEEAVERFIIGVSLLECFTYRAVNKVNDELIYWNALAEPYSEFKNTETVIYQAEYPYPTPDMIAHFLRSLKKTKSN